MERGASVFIVLLAVFCVVLGGGGSEPEQVRTVAELMNVFAGKTEPVTTDIELLADLDFSAEGLGYPLGAASGACVPYMGKFDGQGHTIRGITMDNAGKIVYNHAALLCDLSGGVVMNLVIDASCHFTGNWAAAVAVRASSRAALRNVTSRATVTGSSYAGGLVAAVANSDHTTLRFEGCATTGRVTGGSATARSPRADSTPAGGLVGTLRGAGLTVTLTNCTNGAEVRGVGATGGLVGLVSTEEGGATVEVEVQNCANTAAVAASAGAACGLVCAGGSGALALSVRNSANRARVAGESAFGVAGGVDVAHADNVVSMGALAGTQEAHSLWRAAAEATSTFVLAETCQDCANATQFRQDPADGLYYTEGESAARVDALLNAQVEAKGYTMLWSETLDLVAALPGSSSSSSFFSTPDSRTTSSNPDPSLASTLSIFTPLALFFSLILLFFGF